MSAWPGRRTQTLASPGSSLWQLTSGEWSGSRIGFRGREDLGGGLYAGFHIEAGIDTEGSPIQVADASTRTDIGADHHSFRVLAAAFDRARQAALAAEPRARPGARGRS